jgi:hypothetical protein
MQGIPNYCVCWVARGGHVVHQSAHMHVRLAYLFLCTDINNLLLICKFMYVLSQIIDLSYNDVKRNFERQFAMQMIFFMKFIGSPTTCIVLWESHKFVFRIWCHYEKGLINAKSNNSAYTYIPPGISKTQRKVLASDEPGGNCNRNI